MLAVHFRIEILFLSLFRSKRKYYKEWGWGDLYIDSTNSNLTLEFLSHFAPFCALHPGDNVFTLPTYVWSKSGPVRNPQLDWADVNYYLSVVSMWDFEKGSLGLLALVIKVPDPSEIIPYSRYTADRIRHQLLTGCCKFLCVKIVGRTS